MSDDSYSIDNLLPGPDEPWDDYTTRIGAIYRAAPPVAAHIADHRRPHGRPPLDRSALLAAVPTDRHRPTAEIAAAAGVTVATVRHALRRARGLEHTWGDGWRRAEVLA